MNRLTLIFAAASAVLLMLVGAMIVQPYYAYRISEKLGFQSLGYRAVAHGETMRHLNTLRGEQGIPVTHAFYGASTIEGLDVRRFGAGAVNHAIGGSTIEDVLNRWREDGSAVAGRDVVLLAGFNDLARGRSIEEIAGDIDAMLSLTGGTGRILVIGVLPVDEGGRLGRRAKNEAIAETNLAMRGVCANHQNCFYANPRVGQFGFSAPLAEEYDAGDGVHLNANGYIRLGQFIEAELAALSK